MQQLIWLFLDSRNFGGIESLVLQLAIGLVQSNFTVKVVFYRDYGAHPMKTLLEDSNIQYESINGGWFALKKQIQRQQPVLIHSHGYKAGILARLASQFSSTLVISSYHAGEVPIGMLKIYDWLDRYTSFMNVENIAVSEQIAQRIPFSSRVVANFLENKTLPISTGLEVAFVGRLSHEKGLDYFLDLVAECPDIPFSIYGDGPQKDLVDQRLSSNLTFYGQQSSMEDHWQNINVLVLTSRQEGLPMVALEALSRGIPVIASDVGDLPKVILNGQNGWLYPSGDTTALTGYLLDWFDFSEDEQLNIRRFSQQNFVKNYSTEAVMPVFLSIYHHAVGGA
jgi:glycosyltransferase involved in cell wall biosynthesis